MSLIISNPTADDVIIDDLGLTVFASDTYDMSTRQVQSIAASQQLADNIATGNLVVIADTLNVLANATGYMTIAGGGTAARPASPIAGATRVNTDTGFVEMYANSQWNNMPLLSNSSIEFSGIGSLYYKDVNNDKFLTIAVSGREWVSQDTSNKAWLQVQEAFVGSSTGYVAGLPMTIVSIQATSSTNTPKTLSLYVDDTEYPEIISWDETYVPGTTVVGSIVSFDCDPDQKVRFRVYGGRGSLGAIQVEMTIRIRRT